MVRTLGKWIKDTLFPDELEYKLEKRRQNFNAENARTLFNEEELRRIDSRQMVAEEESARIVLRLIIAMRALRKVTVKDIVPNVDYARARRSARGRRACARARQAVGARDGPFRPWARALAPTREGGRAQGRGGVPSSSTGSARCAARGK